jgi:hypothetical protein
VARHWVIVGAAAAAACVAACDDALTLPTPALVAACERNRTATVTFGNLSSALTFTIRLNGTRVATLGPGRESVPLTVAADVAQTVEFAVAATNRVACNPSEPVFTACSANTVTCR